MDHRAAGAEMLEHFNRVITGPLDPVGVHLELDKLRVGLGKEEVEGGGAVDRDKFLEVVVVVEFQAVFPASPAHLVGRSRRGP